MSIPLKAYVVTEEMEGTGGVVFAKSNVEARRKGAAQYGDGDLNWGKARRAAWADEYAAKGHVPLIAMLDQGWHFECGGCGQRIEEGATDDDDKEIEFDPVEVGETLYCNPQCRNDYVRRKNRLRAFECTVIDSMQTKLLGIAPGVWLVGKPHVYATGEPLVAQQCVIDFRFPGCVHGSGHFRFDKTGDEPHITVCFGDRPAWDNWRASVANGDHTGVVLTDADARTGQAGPNKTSPTQFR